MTPEEQAAEVTSIIKAYIDAATRPLLDQISSLQKQISELPVPKDGQPGADGKDGKDAEPAPLPKDGEPGKDGRDGRDGRDGADGKDALQIDILPAINEEKKYPKGIYATHKGGLWYSKHETDGMNGWQLIVDGLNKMSVSKSADRKFIATCERSSGKVQRNEFNMPVMIYKGVYKIGNGYLQGDTVTWAGSVWHCNEDTFEKPGEDKSWILMAKRGQDGKSERPDRK